MRDYAKCSGKFWISGTGKDIKRIGLPPGRQPLGGMTDAAKDAVILAFYLKTCPQSNMLGLYYLPLVTMAHESGLAVEEAIKALQSLHDVGFCEYDEGTEVVWVYEMATYQIGEALKPGDNQVKGVQSQYDALPKNPFLARFYERYSQAFHMARKRDDGGDSVLAPQAPTKPLQSQEQEQRAGAESSEQEMLRAPQTKKPAPRKEASERAISAVSMVWDAYSKAFQERWGTEPTRNAKVNGQLAQFVARVPQADAPAVAAYYVAHPGRFYERSMHAVDGLLKDAEALHAQWRQQIHVGGQAPHNSSDKHAGAAAAIWGNEPPRNPPEGEGVIDA